MGPLNGRCVTCQTDTSRQCSACREVYYCSKRCQSADWAVSHSKTCNRQPYRVDRNAQLGRYLVAKRDLVKGEIILTDKPLVCGPRTYTRPVCLACYRFVDGSFRCRKSGWPLCGPKCEARVAHNAEVVLPHQTEADFVIDDFDRPCYLYECIAPLRAIVLQKTAPDKFATLMKLEAHLEARRSSATVWARTDQTVVVPAKKTLGLMVYEALYPQLDLSDDMLQRIAGIFDTNAIDVRIAAATESGVRALYPLASLLQHACVPNVAMTYDKKLNVTMRAATDIKAGDQLAICYSNTLWTTELRRHQLVTTKHFWCECIRCADPTELQSHFSTLIQNGRNLVPENPLTHEPPCDWVSEDGANVRMAGADVAAVLAQIESELTPIETGIMATLDPNAPSAGSIADLEAFVERYENFVLHPQHRFMFEAKHALLQMYGRVDGYLIQDISESLLERKASLCRQTLATAALLDPHGCRLQIYVGSAKYELHFALLQIYKRQWESGGDGGLSTEAFRTKLAEPHRLLVEAAEALRDEHIDERQEGQLRIQVQATLNQLEEFMRTLGCAI